MGCVSRGGGGGGVGGKDWGPLVGADNAGGGGTAGRAKSVSRMDASKSPIHTSASHSASAAVASVPRGSESSPPAPEPPPPLGTSSSTSSSTSRQGWQRSASETSSESSVAARPRPPLLPPSTAARSAATSLLQLTCRQCTGGDMQLPDLPSPSLPPTPPARPPALPPPPRQVRRSWAAANSALLPLPAAPVTSSPPLRGRCSGALA